MATTKKLMTLLSMQGLADKRGEIVSELTKGRTTSVRQLYQWELDDLCLFLENAQKKQNIELDKKRKRLMAAIYGINQKLGKKVSEQYVNGIACQAAKVDDFNKIPAYKLDNLYAVFTKQQKDLDFSKRYVTGLINEAISYN